MSTLPRTAPASTALVQHYAQLDEGPLGIATGIATLVSGGYYIFAHDNGVRSMAIAYTDPRLTLLGHVHTADAQWQRDLDARKVWEQAHV